MKKIIFFTGILLTIIAFSSCEEYLAKNPESDLSEAQIYSDYDRFKGTVDRISGLLHNYAYSAYDYGGEMGTCSDECQQAVRSNSIINEFNPGNWLNSTAPHLQWTFYTGQDGSEDDFESSGDWEKGKTEFHFRKWTREIPGASATGIRACNIAIDNIGLLTDFPDESYYTQQELRDQLLGQAYLFRAWFYFMIIRDFGGMPSLHTVFDADANFDVVRPEYWVSSKLAAEDAKKAIDLLPDSWAISSDIGRPTKTTARAVRSMILLYQASPNMSIPRNQSLSFSGTANYVDSILPKAVDAATEALASAISATSPYRLLSKDEYLTGFYFNTLTEHDMYYSPENIFQPPHSDQVFVNPWGGVETGMADFQGGTGNFLPFFDAFDDWANYAVPTQNAVDFFETADGWELGDNWPTTTGDAENNSDFWDKNNPYDYRDERLKAFIFTHGDNMYKSSAPILARGLSAELDSREGKGHAKKVATKNHNFTGFYHGRKYRWPGNSNPDVKAGDGTNNAFTYVVPYIRVAQLYLDLAELANELYGPEGAIATTEAIDVTSALDCINKVRNRAGMPNVKDKYKTDKATFRDYIRKERARELFFEQHRWQDLKRWRIAHEVYNKGIWVADIQQKDGTTDMDSVTYSKRLEPSFVRTFENKHYWYPFQQTDMFLFENFEQNPGW